MACISPSYVYWWPHGMMWVRRWYDHRADGTLHGIWRHLAGSEWASGGHGSPALRLRWTDVAALRRHSTGMRIVARSRSDLPDLPSRLPFSKFRLSGRRLGRRLEGCGVLLPCMTVGVIGLLEGLEGSAVAKSPDRVHPNLPP